MSALNHMSGSPCGPVGQHLRTITGIPGSTYDADLQAQIDEATLRLMFSPNRDARMRAMDELRKLKEQQRPERIAELEKMRGLR